MADLASNVQALAAAVGVPYPLVEEDLGIGKLYFCSRSGTVTGIDVPATDDNKASRLFVEVLARGVLLSHCPWHLSGLERFQVVAAEYFAEYWDDHPGEGVHPIIDGIRLCERAVIAWKPVTLRRYPPLTFTGLLTRVRYE